MQSVSSKIWTRVAVSIFYDDNHYTKGTSLLYKSPWDLRKLAVTQAPYENYRI